MTRTAIAKQDTVNIRTHMPMVPTTSKGMLTRHYTKTSNGHLRVICCREMNETAGGRPMGLVIWAATPYRAFRVFLCVVVRIVLPFIHRHSLIAPRCIVPPILQIKDISMLISGCSYILHQYKSHGTLTGKFLQLAPRSRCRSLEATLIFAGGAGIKP